MPKSFRNQRAFTLIELLIVVIIIAILALLTFVSFSTVQRNARDAQRKGDLQTIAGALQRFYSDNSKYPESNGGNIRINSTCATEPGTAQAWGTGNITCNGESYIKQLPNDPRTTPAYCYMRTVGNQSYELHANLETSTGNNYTCNGTSYNYRVTPND